MIYRGTVKHGVVELEEGAALPDGTQVKVEPLVLPAGEGGKRLESIGWPPGYFEQTFGSITDDTFARPPQGELPEAVELE
jgi:hypothetical protein